MKKNKQTQQCKQTKVNVGVNKALLHIAPRGDLFVHCALRAVQWNDRTRILVVKCMGEGDVTTKGVVNPYFL